MDVSEFDNLEDYKKDVREKLQKEVDERNKINLENQVIEKLIEMNDINAPKAMVEERIDQEVHEYEHNLQHMGIDLKGFFQATGSSEEDLRNEFRDKAEKSVKAGLLLDAIVKKENIEVTDEDVEKEYNEVAKQYGQEGNEEFLKSVKASIGEDYIREIVAKRQVVEKLVDNVKFVEKKEEENEDKE